MHIMNININSFTVIPKLTRGEIMFEVANNIVANIPIAIVAAIIAGILRSIAGYIENVYRDGSDQQFESKKLLGTIVQYFQYVMLLMLGLPVGPAVAGAFVIDAGKSSLTKRNGSS